MKKQLLSLLLTLALLLCAAAALGEQTPSLSPERVSALQSLAGEDGAQWQEGTTPSTDMNAFQMWQWTDWFLSNQVRSLLGTLQEVELLDAAKSLDAQAKADQWKLRETESTLSRYEAQLEEDRLAILNGLRVLESEAGDAERLAAYQRIVEAEGELRQIIGTICGDYQTYLAAVNGCITGLQTAYGSYVLGVHTGASAVLASEASKLEKDENSFMSDLNVSVISTRQFCVTVLDPAQKPVRGATVTVTNPLNRTWRQAETDAQGNAVFWVGDLGADETGELLLNLRLEASGYRTREAQSVRLRSGETRSVEMEKDDGSPYLIMGCFSGRDILTETNTYYSTKENTANLAFTVKLHCKTDGELELLYPVDASGNEFASVVKAFSAADSDSTVLRFEDQWLSKLIPGARVSFTIRTGGVEYTTNTYLCIQPAVVDAPILSEDTLFSFPGSMSATLPSVAAFVGGSSLSLNLPTTLSRTAYLPSGAALYALGYDFKPEQAGWQTRDTEAEARAIKDFELRGKADEALATAGAYSDINATEQSPLLDGNEAIVTPFAKLAGQYRAYDQSLSLSGAAGATVAFRSDITRTFEETVFHRMSGIASAKLSMGEGFGMDVASDMTLDVTDGVPSVVGEPKSGFETTVSLGMQLGSTSGLGVRENVTAALRSYGSVKATANPAASSLTAGANISTDISLRELFLWWSRTGNEQEKSGGANFTGVWVPTTPQPPEPTTGSKGLEPLQTDMIFDQLDSAAGELRYVQIGGQTYAFWFQASKEGDNVKIPVKMRWCNLDDPGISGEITHLNIEGETVKRGTAYTDYAFAVEARGEYSALTILSGKFSDKSSETPSESCVTTVLVKKNGSGIDIVGYKEGELIESGDYPVMPQVQLDINSDGIFVTSTCIMKGNPQQITGIRYKYEQSDPNKRVLQKQIDLTCEDGEQIARHSIASQQDALYALNDVGELSRLTETGRKVLAKGEIVSFQVLRAASGDRLFYLERVATQTGGDAYRLRSVTSDGTQKTDYGVDAGATLLDIASVDGGVYLYWKEYAATDAGAACLLRCVRYDPDSDIAYGPFSLAELPETTCVVKLLDGNDCKGYYSADTKRSEGSYLRLSVSRFTYGPVASADITAAVLTDPCVSAGDDAELVLSVRNTGNTPLSALDVEIRDTGNLVQTLHISLDDPTKSKSSDATGRTMTGENALRRISGMYDPLNHDSWTITDTTAAGTTTRSVRTGLLMPGDTRSYQVGLHIPADWAGGNTLVVKIVGVADVSWTRDAAQGATVRLNNNEMKLDTNAHDLMLSAQLYQRGGEDYVHITIRNRSGNTDSNVTPVLTASSRGKTLYTHTFNKPMGDGFGYSMDVPLKTLTKGQQLPELELHVSAKNNAGYEDFADSDNHVRLLLIVRMCIVGQPQSLSVFEEQEAAFSVAVTGGIKPYRYQWQQMTGAGQWRDIPGEAQEICRIASASLEQNGLTVRCVITDRIGDSVTSEPATLTVLPKLCIVEQPRSIRTFDGAQAEFSVTAADGEKPYRYQWQQMTGADQWSNIPGEAQDTLRIASVSLGQSGLTVRCVVMDQPGNSVISEPAALTVLPRLCIVDHPQSLTVTEGEKAEFSVTAADGEKPYRYQWQYTNGVDPWEDIPGETQASYRIASAGVDQDGMGVRCVVTDQNGDSVASEPAELTVLGVLRIVDQPRSVPAAVGSAAVFTVSVTGGQTPYRYQWQRMAGADQWKDIPGETQTSYRIASVKADQNGMTVRCVITDQIGNSVTSDAAMLSILPQTGDSSQLTLWLLLALSSAAALVMAYRKRCSR